MDGNVLKINSLLRLFKAYIKLTRPIGAVIVGMAVFIGQTIALRTLPDFPTFSISILAAVFLTSASFVINDYFDLEIDIVNRPDRPLPSGIVSRKNALYFWLMLTAVGFYFAFIGSFLSMITIIFAYSLSILYSICLKAHGLIGNITVAFCVSLAFIFGGLSVINSIDPIIFLFFILSFFSNLGREIIQGIKDAHGGRIKKLRSVAIIRGPRFAAFLGSICYVLTAVLGPITFLHISGKFEISILKLLIILVPEAGFILSISSLLRKPSNEKVAETINQVNVWMLLVLVVSIIALNV